MHKMNKGEISALREERLAILAECVADDVTRPEAARRMGISTTTARLYFLTHAPDQWEMLRHTSNHLTNAQRAERIKTIIEMTAQGATLPEIAASLGITLTPLECFIDRHMEGDPSGNYHTKPAPRVKMKGPPKINAEPAIRFGSVTFTAAQDERIRKAKGCYKKLAKIADKVGCTHRQIQQRWHQIRSGVAA